MTEEKNSILIVLLSILFFSVFFISCGSKGRKNETSAAVSDAKPDITIGFSVQTFIIERWQRDVDIFINAAKNLGANVIVQSAGNSVSAQNSQIRYLINKGVDVLVIVPKESDTLTDTLRLAHLRGIPVISYDRLICNAEISLYITVDSRKVGAIMAQGLADMKPEGLYMCIY